MNVIGVNGSPRKKWNTETLLRKALEGAASQGAATELFHLYDLDFKGCISCFACKTIHGPSYGRCGVKDGLTDLLRKVEEAEVMILASPIYFGTVSGEMRSFMERLLFPYLTYTDPPGSLFARTIRTGFISTFNATEEMAKEWGFDRHTDMNEMLLRMMFGHSESLLRFDTCQFEDYSKVFAPRWDPEKKARRRAEVFPVECERAFEMGARLARESSASQR